MFRNNGSKPEDDHNQETLSAKALVLLFQAERENSIQAAEKMRSSTSFKIVEDQNIILLQGRKYDPGPNENPSVIRIEDPKLEVLVQGPESHAYSVPLVNPATALGRAVCKTSNNLCHAESATSTNAQANRYWRLIPSGMPVFKHIASSCYKCTRILQRRGTDIIAPLRSIGTTILFEGQNLMLDVAGP